MAADLTINDEILWQILDDQLSDRQVCELIWMRLGYQPSNLNFDGHSPENPWPAGPLTPAQWREAYPSAPDFIANRPPVVMLTRSIPADLKQLLKDELGFKGYRIGELQPRLTRRATAVSWLLAWRHQQMSV